MCGGTGEEKLVSAEQGKFFQELMQSYNTEFAGFSNILSGLTQAFTPMLAGGPDQQGWGPQERAAVATQIGQGVGTNYAHAAQALNVGLGARGGGNEFLPTGSADQLNEMLASQAAATQSNEQLAATIQNYNVGRQNFFQAAGALGGEAGLMNPVGFAGQATGAGGAAFGSAQELWQQGNEWVGALGGVVGGAASAFGGGMGAAAGKAAFGGGGGGGGGAAPSP